MGLSAEILCIGPYSEAVKHALSYPADYYRDTQQGTTVITHLFQCLPGTTLSKELAACMGITNVWDFNQHKIDLGLVDHQRLEHDLCQRDSTDGYWESYQRLRVLAANGFTFYFIPNG